MTQIGKNHISDLLERIGMDRAKKRIFFGFRVRRIGTNLRKAEIRKRKGISFIYAYDLKTRETITSRCFPGTA